MVFVHPQAEWETRSQPINGPAPKGTPGTWVIHYPGSPSLFEPMTDIQMVSYLRNMQRDYVNSRGYSLGYSVIASQSGSLWAARGIEGYPGVRVYNPASNPGDKVDGNFNHVSRSIQIAVGGNNAASPAAVKAVNGLIATRPDWDVIVHSDVDYTDCAGEGITAQVRSGVIGHQETPPVENEDDDMTMIDQYRAVDTRVWPGVPLPGNESHRLNVGEGVPAAARSVIATVTVTEPDGNGHVTVAQPGGELGVTSSLNFAAGQTIANTTFLPVVNGQLDLKIVNASSHLVIDILGFVT